VENVELFLFFLSYLSKHNYQKIVKGFFMSVIILVELKKTTGQNAAGQTFSQN